MTDLAKRTDVGTVTVFIDGEKVDVPKGELVIRAAERLGIAIPRFCDHPLLAPAGACRQCLVEVELHDQRSDTWRKMPKPVASCTQEVADQMKVYTQHSSEVARKAQAGIMEFLLINHPLDCPMCDKGGECPLQNQAMSAGRPDTRFQDVKREYRKPISISSQVLLDRERCVLCQRCTRFSEEIAGDKFIDLMDRGAAEQINVYRHDDSNLDDADDPFNSYFSGNTVQICPVGALTGTQYRFRSRPFDLVSTPSVCEHCAAGCAQRTDWRRGTVLRRLAGADPAVNEEWNCDKGRWAFRYANATDRITQPLVRDRATGQLRPASWPEALSIAAAGLAAARDGAGVGVLTGGRLTVTDAYAYSKFARLALGTNDIDCRARPVRPSRLLDDDGPFGISEEAEFLAAQVADQRAVTYDDVDRAPAVVLVGLEPEEECPILFLRLRKQVTKRQLPVHAVAPYASRGLVKLSARLCQVVPGAEAVALAEDSTLRAALGAQGSVLFVGERLATVPGGLTAAAELARRTGAKLAWVPRRAGDRGAIEAGCLPHLLPGGRPVADAAARAEVARAWAVDPDALPARPGREVDAMLAAAAAGELDALVVGGVDPDDLADPQAAELALDAVGFLVSLELRRSAVSQRADVVFPVAPVVEKAGAFLTWEGRPREFARVIESTAMSDARVLDSLAQVLGVTLGCGHEGEAAADLAGLPATTVGRPSGPIAVAGRPAELRAGQAVLSTWHQLIDLGTMLDGDVHLGGTARPAVARISAATASQLGIAEGQPVQISTARGAIMLPVLVTDLPEGVVWVPTNSPGSTVLRTLGVTSGAVVDLAAGRIDGGTP